MILSKPVQSLEGEEEALGTVAAAGLVEARHRAPPAAGHSSTKDTGK